MGTWNADVWRFIERISRMTKDGEAFILESDDAIETLHSLIDEARTLANRIA